MYQCFFDEVAILEARFGPTLTKKLLKLSAIISSSYIFWVFNYNSSWEGIRFNSTFFL